MAALIGLGAVLSGFMNNVGAMALLMPVAIKLSKRLDLTPGQVLMPLAFGTILGGMTTLIGTPPNLIVAGFRAEAGLGSFGMFDYTPVGLAVALGGVVFVALVGWRLVPKRKQAGFEGFETGAYLTEARVMPGSKVTGKTLRELDRIFDQAGAQIIGLVRNEMRRHGPESAPPGSRGRHPGHRGRGRCAGRAAVGAGTQARRGRPTASDVERRRYGDGDKAKQEVDPHKSRSLEKWDAGKSARASVAVVERADALPAQPTPDAARPADGAVSGATVAGDAPEPDDDSEDGDKERGATKWC